MTWPELVVSCLLAYLIGAIPFSWLFVRVLKGIDLRTVGSGNLGSTNAMRVLGLPWGIAIQALDILKGWLPVFAAQFLEREPYYLHSSPEGWPMFLVTPFIQFQYAILVVGLAAVLGHMFPVYMKFRGGKGVNTGLGVFLALAPKATLVALAIGLAVLALWRYVSLGSMIGATILPLAVWMFYPNQIALILITAAMAVLIIFMHRSNIRRLLAGTESRLGKRVSMEKSREQKPDPNQA